MSPNAVHIRDATGCVILLPVIEGSTLLCDLLRCAVVTSGCHQVCGDLLFNLCLPFRCLPPGLFPNVRSQVNTNLIRIQGKVAPGGTRVTYCMRSNSTTRHAGRFLQVLTLGSGAPNWKNRLTSVVKGHRLSIFSARAIDFAFILFLPLCPNVF